MYQKETKRGEKLTTKDKIVLNTIRVKHGAQKVGADPRTGKIGDEVFDKLIFSDGVDLEAPVDQRYKEEIKRMFFIKIIFSFSTIMFFRFFRFFMFFSAIYIF